jgi:hypothetical protein
MQPTTPSRLVHIEHIDIDVRGVDGTTTAAALRVLPSVLAETMSAREPAAEPLYARPGAHDVARQIARQVVAQVNRGGEP